MHNEISQKLISGPVKIGCLTLLLIVYGAIFTPAAYPSSNVLCRPNLSETRRIELTKRLREISGLSDLHFDKDGALRLGSATPVGGSQTARNLLREAVSGSKITILKDASNRADVVFSRVVEGKWERNDVLRPRAYIVLVDFADFVHVTGDRAALAAFNVGWGILHEIAHVVHDSVDAERPSELGECERLVNQIRRECGLAERAEYFYTFFPGMERSAFTTKLVRLAFEQQKPAANKKKRLWLIWDARMVGGLNNH